MLYRRRLRDARSCLVALASALVRDILRYARLYNNARFAGNLSSLAGSIRGDPGTLGAACLLVRDLYAAPLSARTATYAARAGLSGDWLGSLVLALVLS